MTSAARSVGPRLRPWIGPWIAVALLSLALGPGAEARKLSVRKYSTEWSELRSAQDEGTQRIERISRFGQLKQEMPESARHGHLHFGKPLTSLFERPDLQRRASFLRGGAPDTLVIRIAIIRIEFDTDRMGDETTGDGRFMREDTGVLIDPPPHNTDYFAAHLEAVSRYWNSMTYGNVRFEGDVFPRGQEFGAYRLSDLADYGPENEDEFFNIDGLIRYSRESLIVADADPDLVWSDYDIYFVVHAGSDWQNDVFQDTRFDLPTFSISFSDSELVVSDEGDTLSTMITYPETSSQDGFLVALNGGIAHEMGHQLGLFDIYNIETFAPTVAFYSVMDSGNLASVFVQDSTGAENEVIGVLPTCPDPWSRWLVTYNFGIDPPLIKSDLAGVQLRAIQSRATDAELPGRGRKWFRVPISDSEYFLVENRVDDLDGRTPDGGFNTALDQDDATGVVLGPIKGDSDDLSHNYDLLIDPGVLIWHIDDRQALANLTIGRGLNVQFEKRSVTIEEADGFVDIGNPFSLFPLGTPNEAWWEGNATDFTPDTRPNSNSNLGTPTGIAITSIGPRDTTVVMDVMVGNKPRGWPMEVGPFGSGGLTSTTLADVDGDGVSEVLACGDANAHLFRYEDVDGDGDVDIPGVWPAPTGDVLFGKPVFTQTVGDFDGNDSLEVAAVTDSGAVYLFSADGTAWPGADSTGVLLQFAPGAGPTWSAIPADLDGDGSDELYLVTRDGRLRGYDVGTAGPPTRRFPPRLILGAAADSLVTTLGFADVNGDGRDEGYLSYVYSDSLFVQRFAGDGFRTLRTGYRLPEGYVAREVDRVWLAFADLDRAPGGALEIVLVTQGGLVTVLNASIRTLPGWPLIVEHLPVAGPPAIGDLDGDGWLEFAISSGIRSVHAYNYNATEMAGWPVHVTLVDYPRPGRSPGPPVIADADGDGRQDVILGFTDFTIHAIAPDGTEADGFPLSAGAPLVTAPAVLDANGDGRLDLFLQAGDGKVAGHILAGTASATNPQWPMYGGGPRLHGAFDASRTPTLQPAAGRVLAGPVVVYPNPARAHQDDVRIRYTLGPRTAAATQVSVSVYNTAGEKVLWRAGSTFENTENEVVVRTDDLSSGVYFCTIRARSGATVESAQVKFAVIR